MLQPKKAILIHRTHIYKLDMLIISDELRERERERERERKKT